jgi:hypothetical protein
MRTRRYNPPTKCSPIAQLVEQATVNRFVAGSSPARGAILSKVLVVRLYSLPQRRLVRAGDDCLSMVKCLTTASACFALLMSTSTSAQEQLQSQTCKPLAPKGLEVRTDPDRNAPLITRFGPEQELFVQVGRYMLQDYPGVSPDAPDWFRYNFTTKLNQRASIAASWMLASDVACWQSNSQGDGDCYATTQKRWDEMPFFSAPEGSLMGRLGAGSRVEVISQTRQNGSDYVQIAPMSLQSIAGWVHRSDLVCTNEELDFVAWERR